MSPSAVGRTWLRGAWGSLRCLVCLYVCMHVCMSICPFVCSSLLLSRRVFSFITDDLWLHTCASLSICACVFLYPLPGCLFISLSLSSPSDISLRVFRLCLFSITRYHSVCLRTAQLLVCKPTIVLCLSLSLSMSVCSCVYVCVSLVLSSDCLSSNRVLLHRIDVALVFSWPLGCRRSLDDIEEMKWDA